VLAFGDWILIGLTLCCLSSLLGAGFWVLGADFWRLAFGLWLENRRCIKKTQNTASLKMLPTLYIY